MYTTVTSQADGVVLEVPQSASSVYKSTEHCGLSFTYDAPLNWNDLPNDVPSATSLSSFRKKVKNYLCTKCSKV